jgi:hypothetical protein
LARLAHRWWAATEARNDESSEKRPAPRSSLPHSSSHELGVLFLIEGGISRGRGPREGRCAEITVTYSEARRKHRFAIELNLRWQLIARAKVLDEGTGKTLNWCSRGFFFQTDRRLPSEKRFTSASNGGRCWTTARLYTSLQLPGLSEGLKMAPRFKSSATHFNPEPSDAP